MKRGRKSKAELRRKWNSKRAYQRLIKEISQATMAGTISYDYRRSHAVNFAALLSAMRGPDNEDESLKEITTARIRQAVGWRCGIMREGAPENVERGEPHFVAHINNAKRALRHFGLWKKEWDTIA